LRIGIFNINRVNSVPPVPTPPTLQEAAIPEPYVDKTYRAPFTKSELISFMKTMICVWLFGIVGAALYFVFRALGIENYDTDVFVVGITIASLGSFMCIIIYAFWIRDAITDLKWDWNILHKFGYYRHWHIKFAETDYDKMRRQNQIENSERLD